MPAEFDSSEFVDRDFQASTKAPSASSHPFPGSASESASRPPTREELDAKVTQTQQKLTELKRAQEQLERERAALEEARRRQGEFQMGRTEMIQHLTRGVGLLEEAEFAARRDAEQMNKTLADLRDASAKVQAIRDETWTQDNYEVELTRALTTIENARMEWNSARLKWPVLSSDNATSPQPAGAPLASGTGPWPGLATRELCKLGLALTWPLTLVALLALAAWLVFLFNR